MNDARGPLAIDRVFTALDLLASRPAGCSLADLTRALNVPKSSLLGLLRGMVATGHVVIEGHVYRLGPASLALARNILNGQPDLVSLAEPVLRKLTFDSSETSILAVMTADEQAIEYVAKIEGSNAIRFAATVGDRRLLHASVGGRLLVSYQSDAWIEDFLHDARFERPTARTEVDPDRLRAIFRKIRSQCYAETAGDMTDGVMGLAMPVFDGAGRAVAAMILGGPIDRMSGKKEMLLTILRPAAESLSHQYVMPKMA